MLYGPSTARGQPSGSGKGSDDRGAPERRSGVGLLSSDTVVENATRPGAPIRLQIRPARPVVGGNSRSGLGWIDGEVVAEASERSADRPRDQRQDIKDREGAIRCRKSAARR